MAGIDTCRSCGAPILWAVTNGGKRMPLDATPREGGRWVLGTNEHLSARPQTTLLGHDSHFATCPGAAAHRGHPRSAA